MGPQRVRHGLVTEQQLQNNPGEDEMAGWHHQLKGHESAQTPGDGEGQGSLERCSPQACKESDMT